MYVYIYVTVKAMYYRPNYHQKCNIEMVDKICPNMKLTNSSLHFTSPEQLSTWKKLSYLLLLLFFKKCPIFLVPTDFINIKIHN